MAKESNKKEKSGGKKLNRRSIARSFLACGRCSFFLSGYRLIHDDFDQAADSSQSGWLDLSWNQATSILLSKSIGRSIDQGVYHYACVCPECRRSFVYEIPEDAPAEPSFRVEIKPGR